MHTDSNMTIIWYKILQNMCLYY